MRSWLITVCLVPVHHQPADAQEWKRMDGDALFVLAREKAFNGNREEAHLMLSEVLSGAEVCRCPHSAGPYICLGWSARSGPENCGTDRIG